MEWLDKETSYQPKERDGSHTHRNFFSLPWANEVKIWHVWSPYLQECYYPLVGNKYHRLLNMRVKSSTQIPTCKSCKLGLIKSPHCTSSQNLLWVWFCQWVWFGDNAHNLSQKLGMFINWILFVWLMRLVSIIPTCYIEQSEHVCYMLVWLMRLMSIIPACYIK